MYSPTSQTGAIMWLLCPQVVLNSVSLTSAFIATSVSCIFQNSCWILGSIYQKHEMIRKMWSISLQEQHPACLPLAMLGIISKV